MSLLISHDFPVFKSGCCRVLESTEIKVSIGTKWFIPFVTNVPILYPLKTPENLSFSGAFRGCKMRTLARNGLKIYPVTRCKGKQNWCNTKRIENKLFSAVNNWLRKKLKNTNAIRQIKFIITYLASLRVCRLLLL